MRNRPPKPIVTVTISGAEQSGKTILFKILKIWLERTADYQIVHDASDFSDLEVLIAEDRFHKLRIEVTGKEVLNG